MPATDYELVIENKGSGMSLIQDLKTGQHSRGCSRSRWRQDDANERADGPDRGGIGILAKERAAGSTNSVREILAFPAGRYTDQVDALSQALIALFNRRGEVSSGFVAGFF